jgi:DNA-directed RNA polymerase specialized sigma24 family protein
VKQRRQANRDMDAAELRKIKGQALEEARARTGAKKHQIEITDEQWHAIQSNAISIDKMKNILNNTDIEKLKERATPRDKKVVTPAMASRALAMHRAGVTYAEMADALGISESTLQTIIKEGG